MVALQALLFVGYAQEKSVRGKVFGLSESNSKQPLIGANVMWLNTLSGVITTNDGSFALAANPSSDSIVVSYSGFQSDTIIADFSNLMVILLREGVELAGAEIVHRVKSTVVSHSAVIHTENLGHGELHKAACCNLSESFETSPSVDVNFSDAITGTRQIRMLGLAGKYSQLTRENMPDIRGLSSFSGMDFIPGTWISSIQLIKGAGSVVNGYESIAGQINTELQRPSSMPPLFINFYINNDQQAEANVQFKHHIGKSWMNSVLLHGKYADFKRDMNKDGFADKPATKQIVVMDRIEWINDRQIHLEFGGRFIFRDQEGGQVNFERSQTMDSLHPWGMTNQIGKADLWAKIGKVNPLKPWQSSALQISASAFQQKSRYGLKEYIGNQQSFYVNFLHKGQIINDKHEFTLGASVIIDQFDEQLDKADYERLESVPGVFGEFTFKPKPSWSVVLGLRADYHNQYQWFMTPRIHGRFQLFPNAILRLSAGRGLRTANIVAENIFLLASNRQWVIKTESDYGFGLKPEIAWNYGANFTYSFEINYREAVLGLAFYRTDFSNQIIIDLEQDYRKVHFYNLDGLSYANSAQFQLDYELFRRFDIRLAYRWFDVKSTYNSRVNSAPLVASHRGFLNLAYETRNDWKFDMTFNGVGPKRIPINSLQSENSTWSPSYLLVNAQVTKIWNEIFDLYLGVENLTNYHQTNPIILASTPYQDGFDASLIWGPIWGQHVYLGFRWTILE